MKRAFGSVALLLLLAAFPAGAAGFLSVYEDLPLPAGVAETPGTALSFDSPDGRIVEAEARGRTDAASVKRFYHAALPQLGWFEDGPAQFHREQEVLRIETTDAGDGTLVIKYKVSPK